MKTQNNDTLFSMYPDVLSVADLRRALNISRLGAYKLLRSGSIPCFKIGNTYKIPKTSLIHYVEQQCNAPKGDSQP